MSLAYDDMVVGEKGADVCEGSALGIPVCQGSVSPIAYRRKNGKLGVNVFQKPELLAWRETVAEGARKSLNGRTDIPFPKGTPVEVIIYFYLPRPKTNKNKFPVGRVGDIDKLERAMLDAFTGILYDDDSQVVALKGIKVYVREGEQPGVQFSARKIGSILDTVVCR